MVQNTAETIQSNPISAQSANGWPWKALDTPRLMICARCKSMINRTLLRSLPENREPDYMCRLCPTNDCRGGTGVAWGSGVGAPPGVAEEEEEEPLHPHREADDVRRGRRMNTGEDEGGARFAHGSSTVS